MSGICGIVLPTNSRRRPAPRLVERMRDVLTHRGPDGCGLFIDGHVALAHRRLSVVDLPGGHQPMSSDDGSLVIVKDGKAFNHFELRPKLERCGHRFRTRSDTETVLHLYQEFGAAAVPPLRGMFAFAIWDARKQELFLARDPLGVRPLYYVHAEDGSLYFASEIKALLEAGAVKAALNLDALPDYLANRAPSGAETLFQGVRCVLPGHTLRWRNGKIEHSKYWDLDLTLLGRSELPDEDLVEEFSERLSECLRLQLLSDVPVGVLLSGGIDSAALAASMSRIVDEPVKTFSIGLAGREANELSYAREVAAAFGADHHDIVFGPDEFFAALPGLVWQEDEPLAYPANVALHLVAKLAAEHVKVVLAGDGCDVLVGGLRGHRNILFNLRFGGAYERVTPAKMRAAIKRLISGDSAGPLRRRLDRTFLGRGADIESVLLDRFAVFRRALQMRLLSVDAQERIDVIDPYSGQRAHLPPANSGPLLDRVLVVLLKTYVCEHLMKLDQTAMAASIESREPYMDHRLVEFAFQLPPRMKIRGKTNKYILRQALKDVLPKRILERQKMGIPVPIGTWLRGSYRGLLSEYVVGGRAAERGLFRREELERLVEEHTSMRRDHRHRLWSLINLELWHRQFIDGEGKPDAVDPGAVDSSRVGVGR